MSVISILLLHNAKIDHEDGTGTTALHAAVRSGSHSAVVALIHAGAVVDHRDTTVSVCQCVPVCA